ncbi:MAG: hypothetical protein LBJ86_02870, partial [Spirochaetaceae bacterium]|nr:hypothetical protein [Spirochaetaceae bacterium]
MADRIKVPFTNTDGLINEEIETLIKASDSDLGCDVIYRSDDDAVTIPRDVLGEWYFNSFRKKVAPVFNKAVKNLLNIRNHLLLQLDLECGNISEEYFDKEESNYLTETGKISFEKLREEVKILFG